MIRDALLLAEKIARRFGALPDVEAVALAGRRQQAQPNHRLMLTSMFIPIPRFPLKFAWASQQNFRINLK